MLLHLDYYTLCKGNLTIPPFETNSRELLKPAGCQESLHLLIQKKLLNQIWWLLYSQVFCDDDLLWWKYKKIRIKFLGLIWTFYILFKQLRWNSESAPVIIVVLIIWIVITQLLRSSFFIPSARFQAVFCL